MSAEETCPAGHPSGPPWVTGRGSEVKDELTVRCMQCGCVWSTDMSRPPEGAMCFDYCVLYRPEGTP